MTANPAFLFPLCKLIKAVYIPLCVTVAELVRIAAFTHSVFALSCFHVIIASICSAAIPMASPTNRISKAGRRVVFILKVQFPKLLFVVACFAEFNRSEWRENICGRQGSINTRTAQNAAQGFKKACGLKSS